VQAKEILHRVQKDWYEEHVNDEGRKEIGFLTIQGNDTVMEDGKVKTMEYLYWWETNQQNSVGPRKKDYNCWGKEEETTRKMEGSNTRFEQPMWQICVVDWDWIQNNLSNAFIGFMKDTRKGGIEGYVRIPEGSAEDHTQQMSLRTATPGAPKMKYKREGPIEDNDRSCILKSAASALSFLGYDRLAFSLCNDLENGRKMECGFEFFQNCMDSSKLEKQERRKIQFSKLKSGVSNILNDSKEYVMCLVGLYSSDSKTDHSVSIAGDWIFDSNFEYALTLCKESLDLCCSSDQKKTTFVGVTRVCMLKPVVNTFKK
jgi:hypothetical protein